MDNTKENSPNFDLNGQPVTPQEFLSFVATEGIAFHFGQSAEDAILLRLFNRTIGGFYVDVGAFHPRLYSNTFLLHRYFGWSGINIDASAETIELFNLERPGDINLHLAVGLKEGTALLHKFDHPARNTLSAANVKRQLAKGDTERIGEEKVKVMPLRKVLADHLPKDRRIDLMNVDVEGLDLEALKSNDWGKFRPKVIAIEDYGLLENGPGQSQISTFLADVGYRLGSHSFDTSFYIDSHISAASLASSGDRQARQFVKQQFKPEPIANNRLRSLLELSLGDYQNGLGDKDGEQYVQLTRGLEASNARKAKELEELTERLAHLRRQNAALADDARKAEDLHYGVAHSLAWRKTQPVREVIDRIRRRKP